jgi:ubiquitin-conjugating enzyme E2 J2
MEIAIRRLKQDYVHLKKDPMPYIAAEPLPSNILEWHFIIQGPEDSPFEGGYYHGKLVFPKDYPYGPPQFYMITPNGRFAVDRSICMSMSAYHPGSWNPTWTVSTLLEGFLSFMLDKSLALHTITTSAYEKHKMAIDSLDFNLKKSIVKELFPELYDKMSAEVQRRKLKTENAAKVESVESGNPFGSLNIAGIANWLRIRLANFTVLVRDCIQFVLSPAIN